MSISFASHDAFKNLTGYFSHFLKGSVLQVAFQGMQASIPGSCTCQISFFFGGGEGGRDWEIFSTIHDILCSLSLNILQVNQGVHHTSWSARE